MTAPAQPFWDDNDRFPGWSVRLGVAIVQNGGFEWVESCPEWFADALDKLAEAMEQWYIAGMPAEEGEFTCVLPAASVTVHARDPLDEIVPIWPPAGITPPPAAQVAP